MLAETFFRHAFHRIFDEHINYRLKIFAVFFPNAKLLIGGSSAFKNCMNVFDFFARA
jgi:hypothetical protein